MRCFWLPALLFAATALAETVGYWTLHNFNLFCDAANIQCAYKFSISQDDGFTPGDLCLFVVDANNNNNTSSSKSANQTDFSDMYCIGNSQYKVNGGWSPMGFITVVVTDVHANLYAFFAYSAAKIADSQTVREQTRLAYKVGTFDITPTTTTRRRRSGVEWQVLNLNKDYDESTGNTELQFAIQEGSDSLTPCTVIAQGAGRDEEDVSSFRNEKCVESDWVVSWDYSAIADAATLILVEPNTMMKAWFHWDAVSSSENLGNSIRTLASPCDDEKLR